MMAALWLSQVSWVMAAAPARMLILIRAAGPCELFAIYRHFPTSWLCVSTNIYEGRYLSSDSGFAYGQTLWFSLFDYCTGMPREKKVKTAKNAKGSV